MSETTVTLERAQEMATYWHNEALRYESLSQRPGQAHTADGHRIMARDAREFAAAYLAFVDYAAVAEQLAAARREVETVTEQYELACGCLSMIREDLAALMGESLDTTPDMMLNDALRVFARRQRDNLATSRAALEDVRRVVAACAIPYEALLLDEPSRKWIAPAVWETMQRAVLEARRALAQEAGDDTP